MNDEQPFSNPNLMDTVYMRALLPGRVHHGSDFAIRSRPPPVTDPNRPFRVHSPSAGDHRVVDSADCVLIQTKNRADADLLCSASNIGYMAGRIDGIRDASNLIGQVCSDFNKLRDLCDAQFRREASHVDG